ncbi:unnamed protein product [Didymodactylos carnosus]|uniref:Large ribosomal subunit protein uL10m n=1 Tax=Didymodactylos carnosus TaxID=1234261 RepID=A0A8S2CLZ4_9BILA|nr:unnamed protein product [Didymodactylos carnosus]CAF3496294.1 unnamed protein product [Didymodactylos carnosus]
MDPHSRVSAVITNQTIAIAFDRGRNKLNLKRTTSILEDPPRAQRRNNNEGGEGTEHIIDPSESGMRGRSRQEPIFVEDHLMPNPNIQAVHSRPTQRLERDPVIVNREAEIPLDRGGTTYFSEEDEENVQAEVEMDYGPDIEIEEQRSAEPVRATVEKNVKANTKRGPDFFQYDIEGDPIDENYRTGYSTDFPHEQHVQGSEQIISPVEVEPKRKPSSVATKPVIQPKAQSNTKQLPSKKLASKALPHKSTKSTSGFDNPLKKKTKLRTILRAELKAEIDEVFDEAEDEEENEFESSEDEIDLDEYKQRKISGVLAASEESAAYQNVLMQQGKIIEDVFIKTIIEEYRLPVFNISSRISDLEKFIQTKQFLEKGENGIIFGSAAIANGCIAKPDALILQDGHLTLVECKGTSASKLYHALDLFYQNNVFAKAEIFIDNFLLGLIGYERLNKGQVSIVLTPYCHPNKSSPAISKKLREELLSHERELLLASMKDGSFKKKTLKELITLEQVNGNLIDFDDIVKSLKHHVITNQLQVVTVVKNTLIDLALKQANISGFEKFLNGPNAIISSSSDEIMPFKLISSLGKQKTFVKIRAGYLYSEVISAQRAEELASIPARESLYAMIASGLQSPLISLALTIKALVERNESSPTQTN